MRKWIFGQGWIKFKPCKDACIQVQYTIYCIVSFLITRIFKFPGDVPMYKFWWEDYGPKFWNLLGSQHLLQLLWQYFCLLTDQRQRQRMSPILSSLIIKDAITDYYHFKRKKNIENGKLCSLNIYHSRFCQSLNIFCMCCCFKIFSYANLKTYLMKFFERVIALIFFSFKKTSFCHNSSFKFYSTLKFSSRLYINTGKIFKNCHLCTLGCANWIPGPTIIEPAGFFAAQPPPVYTLYSTYRTTFIKMLKRIWLFVFAWRLEINNFISFLK
jgi:hypothetical protein